MEVFSGTLAPLTHANLVQLAANPPLPLTPEEVEARLQAIRAAAASMNLELPPKTEEELAKEIARQGKGIMERWTGSSKTNGS